MTVSQQEFRAFHEAFLPFVYEKESVARAFEIALLMRGHILVEDLPGVGKTTAAKAFSRLVGFSFARIQGTSDTLPQDILGGEIYDFETKAFRLREGPIFQETVLVDEINRMHPKTQSAFLQGMEERRIALAGVERALPRHHLVIATQNPVEHAGTFPLPEAQRDRFACLISLGYPSSESQRRILAEGRAYAMEETLERLAPVIDRESLEAGQRAVRDVLVKDRVLDRLMRFLDWSRSEPALAYGISPRGIGAFALAMKANAFLSGRDFVIPEDGLGLVVPFLAHRLVAKSDGEDRTALADMLRERYAEFFG